MAERARDAGRFEHYSERFSDYRLPKEQRQDLSEPVAADGESVLDALGYLDRLAGLERDAPDVPGCVVRRPHDATASGHATGRGVEPDLDVRPSVGVRRRVVRPLVQTIETLCQPTRRSPTPSTITLAASTATPV